MDGELRLRFLGHAAFDLSVDGVRLCLDPHKPGALGGRFQLPAIQGPFDALVCTHRHEDHASWTPELGTQRWIDPPARLGSVMLEARPAFHDVHGGARMGMIRMVSVRGNGIRVVHCGDLGGYDDDDVAWLRGADVLLVPAGGTYTLDGAQAAELVRRVQPSWAVPIHCLDSRIDLPLAPVDDFLTAWTGAVVGMDELVVRRGPVSPCRVALLNVP
ncbi:MAG: MBL fold metallo-hydrolase [Myxococcota bacterium]